MAKSKQSPSAAQRREQTRQQRQNRSSGPSSNQPRRNQNQRRSTSNRGTWIFVGSLLLLVAAVIGVFAFLANQPDPREAQKSQGAAQALESITTLDSNLYATVGAGTAVNQFKTPLPKDANVPKGPTGKPQVLYVGADYCPYCGGMRWAYIMALSRFGTFGPMQGNLSGESKIPTFSFENVKYTSNYVDFVAVETADNEGKPKQKTTEEQEKLQQAYGTQSIPFTLIANKQAATGAFVDTQAIATLSYTDIASQIRDPNSAISKSYVGASNYLTAAICQATDNKPENVCTSAPIPTIQGQINKTAHNNGPQSVVAFTNQAVALPRRYN